MSVPEYVFMHRVEEFYDQLRAGRNLWKIDETLGYIDERGREIIKKWVQDERFPWQFGRGYSLLTQAPPLVSLIVDSDSDRQSGTFLGNYGSDGIDYEPDSITPQSYWQQNARLKTGTFMFVFLAPNADMLSAMYSLVERALYEGESPPVGEENIIHFNDYGISEMRYSGGDIRPDQTFVPTASWGRTLNVTCTYMHSWTGRIWGKNNYVFSINTGTVYAQDDKIQTNPVLVNGNPVLPTEILPILLSNTGIQLYGTTTNNTTSVVLTADSNPFALDNIVIVPQNKTLSFTISVNANANNGQYAGLWEFSGVIRRTTTAASTTIVGISNTSVVADTLFAPSYIDIYEDKSLGGLIISATGLSGTSIQWSARVEAQETE